MAKKMGHDGTKGQGDGISLHNCDGNVTVGCYCLK